MDVSYYMWYTLKDWFIDFSYVFFGVLLSQIAFHYVKQMLPKKD